MQYRDVMNTLSQCGLGAVLAASNSKILQANDAADRLLHGSGRLQGRLLREIAPALWDTGGKPQYANVAFGEYLLLCPSPQADGLPDGCRLVVFRQAVKDACHDMLLGVVNQISESVILCDSYSRIWLLNDAAVRMDSIVTQDVLGTGVSNVYATQDGSELLVPQAIREKRVKRNVRQHYTTRYGKEVDIVASIYPVVQDGQVLGGFSIMEDWSTVDSLHKQIIDLQQKLTERRSGSKSKSELTAKYHFSDIISISPTMNGVVAQCRQVARTDSSVMLYGETGTGKELFAQSIHNASGRADGPFLAINCAAIPENLLEILLFGTEKGAYTGAERRPGLFEQASGGTLLLDEINSMHIGLQSKLLRVLQDGVICRVGGSSEIQVDVRVLSNINIPPYQAIEEGKLRQDLFYRLGVVNINIPPLRERREDIPLLTKHFIMQCNQKLVRNVAGLDQAALQIFQTYRWPGNVRELQHAVEHAMNVLPDDACTITPAYLPKHIGQPAAPETALSDPGGSLGRTIRGIERSTICTALREHQGNISETARAQNEPPEPAVPHQTISDRCAGPAA